MIEPLLDMRDGHAVRSWWRQARMAAAITANSPEAADFSALGANSYLAFPQGALDGTHRIAIGADCVLVEHVVLSAGLGDVLAGDPIIRVGDRCRLGRRTEIVALESVELGEDVWTGPNVYITDHHHRYEDLDATPVAQQWPPTVRPVCIGRGACLSAQVVVLAGAQIGEFTMVAAGAVVHSGTYPPHCLLAGNPARPRRQWRPEIGWTR